MLWNRCENHDPESITNCLSTRHTLFGSFQLLLAASFCKVLWCCCLAASLQSIQSSLISTLTLAVTRWLEAKRRAKESPHTFLDNGECRARCLLNSADPTPPCFVHICVWYCFPQQQACYCHAELEKIVLISFAVSALSPLHSSSWVTRQASQPSHSSPHPTRHLLHPDPRLPYPSQPLLLPHPLHPPFYHQPHSPQLRCHPLPPLISPSCNVQPASSSKTSSHSQHSSPTPSHHSRKTCYQKM